MKKLIVILIVTCFTCKKNQENLIKQSQIDLISYIINTKGYALPPPHSDTINGWNMSQKTIDSVLNVSLNVAIYPILGKSNLNKKVNIEHLEEEYKDLIKKSSIIQEGEIVFIKEINEKSRHNVILADTIILKKSKDWKEYDLLFNFSNLSFNKEFDKATVVVGISRSSLWGSSKLLLLNKDKEGWEIVKSVKLEIW